MDARIHSTAPSWPRSLAYGVFALLCASLLWTGLVWAFGTSRPIEVVSGHSMLPTLRTGEIVLVRGVSPSQLRIGEIVSVHVPRSDQTTYHYPPEIVHRIVGLSMHNGILTVQTKGDNEPAEPFTVPATAIRGRMLVAIPDIGYGVLFLHSRPGRIALIGMAALLLLYFGLSSLLGDGGPRTTPDTDVVALDLRTENAQLAFAIHEYGEHLRSHTRVVQELGATTAELRHAAEAQNVVLIDLGRVVADLAEAEGAKPPYAGKSTVDHDEPPRRRRVGGRPRGRHRRRRHPASAGVEKVAAPVMRQVYATRRERRQRRRG